MIILIFIHKTDVFWFSYMHWSFDYLKILKWSKQRIIQRLHIYRTWCRFPVSWNLSEWYRKSTNQFLHYSTFYIYIQKSDIFVAGRTYTGCHIINWVKENFSEFFFMEQLFFTCFVTLKKKIHLKLLWCFTIVLPFTTDMNMITESANIATIAI